VSGVILWSARVSEREGRLVLRQVWEDVGAIVSGWVAGEMGDRLLTRWGCEGQCTSCRMHLAVTHKKCSSQGFGGLGICTTVLCREKTEPARGRQRAALRRGRPSVSSMALLAPTVNGSSLAAGVSEGTHPPAKRCIQRCRSVLIPCQSALCSTFRATSIRQVHLPRNLVRTRPSRGALVSFSRAD